MTKVLGTNPVPFIYWVLNVSSIIFLVGTIVPIKEVVSKKVKAGIIAGLYGAKRSKDFFMLILATGLINNILALGLDLYQIYHIENPVYFKSQFAQSVDKALIYSLLFQLVVFIMATTAIVYAARELISID